MIRSSVCGVMEKPVIIDGPVRTINPAFRACGLVVSRTSGSEHLMHCFQEESKSLLQLVGQWSGIDVDRLCAGFQALAHPLLNRFRIQAVLLLRQRRNAFHSECKFIFTRTLKRN